MGWDGEGGGVAWGKPIASELRWAAERGNASVQGRATQPLHRQAWRVPTYVERSVGMAPTASWMVRTVPSEAMESQRLYAPDWAAASDALRARSADAALSTAAMGARAVAKNPQPGTVAVVCWYGSVLAAPSRAAGAGSTRRALGPTCPVLIKRSSRPAGTRPA